MYEATASGHLDVVKWLYVNRPESRTPDAIVTAIFAFHAGLHSKFPGFEVNELRSESLGRRVRNVKRFH
jgi:hypothetical protein